MQRTRIPALVILVGSALLGTGMAAETPILLNHQGRLLDGADQPITGMVDLTFRIYGDSSGGTALWTELHPNVPVSEGLYNVTLGSVLAMSKDVLAPAGSGSGYLVRYLEVQVESDPPLSPRARMVASPNAVAASRIDGDVETRQGEISVHGLSDPNLVDEIVLVSRSSGSSVVLLDSATAIGARYRAHLTLANPNDAMVSNSVELGLESEDVSGATNRAVWTTSNPGLATIDNSTSLVMESDGDGDGDPESSTEQATGTGGASCKAIQTKGTGAVARTVLGADDSAHIECDIDGDGDGSRESRVTVTVKNTIGAATSELRLDEDSDDDGLSDHSINASCDSSGARLAVFERVAASTYVASVARSTGASVSLGQNATDLATWSSSDTEAKLSFTPSTAGTYGFELRCGETVGPVLGSSSACFTNSSDDTTIILYGDGRLGLGVAQPAHPVEHSSGAHLTSGGAWTNASDVNLKEHVSDVNGEQLLKRIDQLPLTEWNYKCENPSVRHIGPTAQDVHAEFGLGGSDKTISTVDPSGIALAAIKELSKQNQELQSKNAELERRLFELQKKVDRIVTRA